MNKGIKTTEFWISIIGIIGTLLPAFLGMLSPEKATLVSAFIVGLYTISRMVVKITTNVNDDKIVKAIKENILPLIEKTPKKN